MTEQATPPPMDLTRLHRTTLILTLLAAHPAVAAAPINWNIDDRPEVWPTAPHGSTEAEAAAQALADALGVQVETDITTNGRPMYSVYGKWSGTAVNLHAFGPATDALADNAQVVSA